MGWFDKKKKARTTYGSAEWATQEDLKQAGIWEHVGGSSLRLPGNLYLNDSGHVLSVAPTRSGKGITQVIPSLLFGDNNSAVIIDPKGENAAITAQRRGEFSEVALFNPWNLHDLRCDAINPFDLLDPEDPYVVDDIDLVAELIVPDEGGNQAHWIERARQMVAGLMLYLIFHEPEENRHPLTLRSLLRQSSEDWEAMITFMQHSDKAGGLVAEAGNELSGYGEREFASVRSTAQRATDVFKGPAMQQALTSSNVDITRLAQDQISIYLMIPADKLSTHKQVTRLLIGLLMKTPIRHQGDRRVVFYLDEFASLGYLEIVETAFAQYAGYGVTLWPFVQDISQLKRHYKDSWQSLIANAEVSIFLPNSDLETNKFVSQKVGQTTVSSRSSNGQGNSFSDTGRALITPDEFARINDTLTNTSSDDITAVVFKRGIRPIPMICEPYFNIDWMILAAEPNPFLGNKDAVVHKKTKAQKREKKKGEKLEKAKSRLDKLDNKPGWLWWPSIVCAGIAMIWGTSIVSGVLIGGITFGGLYILRKRIRRKIDGQINQLRGNVPSGQTSAEKSKQWVRWVMGEHWPAVGALLIAAAIVVWAISKDASRGFEIPSWWEILAMMTGIYLIAVLPLIGLKYFGIWLLSNLSSSSTTR